MCVHLHREIYLQEVTHEVMEADKPEICRVGLQARVSEKGQGPLLAEFFPAQGRSVFCSVQAFNSLDETHLYYEGNLFYSKPIDLNADLI